jgi:AcrR family transcriptional regulator
MAVEAPRGRRTPYDGKKQAQNILRAARRVFLRDGPGGFSARRVAKEAKLGVGSVQHVFPTTEALLAGLFEDVVAGYDAAYEQLLAGLPFNPRARFEAIVSYLVDDLADQDTRRLFFGLWALSCHNAHVARLMESAYAYHRDNMAGYIAALRTDLSDDACRLLAIQVIAMIDGGMIFTAPRSRIVAARDFTAALKRSVLALVAGEPPPESAPPRP